MPWEKKPIDKMEMLTFLGEIYARTAVGFEKVGLRKFIETCGKPTVKAKRNTIIKALTETRVLLSEGKQGRRRTYKWNLKDYGAPSLTIAQMLIYEAERLAREKRNNYYQRTKV